MTSRYTPTERFETSAYKIQTPGNYPEENIQHTEHGETLVLLFLLFVSNINFSILIFLLPFT